MTKTKPPSAAEIEARLTNTEAAVGAATEKLGAATLSGCGVASAEAALRDAEAEQRRLEAALTAAMQAEAEQAQQGSAAAASRRRVAAYKYASEFARLARSVVDAAAALRAAEADLAALGANGAIERARQAPARSDLDFEVVQCCPSLPHNEEAWAKFRRRVTAETCDALAARATALIQAEQSGTVAEIATTQADHERDRRERRAERRRQYEATTPARFRGLSERQVEKLMREDKRREEEAQQTTIVRKAVH